MVVIGCANTGRAVAAAGSQNPSMFQGDEIASRAMGQIITIGLELSPVR